MSTKTRRFDRSCVFNIKFAISTDERRMNMGDIAMKPTAAPDTAEGFLYGLKTGTPVAFGYIPSALACGILCKTAGLTAFESVFMSFVVFAGSSQFVALNLIMIGSSMPEIVLTTAVLNMRYMMMSSSMTRRLEEGIGAIKRSLIAFELTDESFSIASMQRERFLSADFMFGLNIVGHISWVVGTLMGFFGTAVMPESVQSSMGIALYALFIGLLLPSVRKSRSALTVAATAMGLSALIKWAPCFSYINRGLAIIIAAGTAALIGTILFPVKKRGVTTR